MLEAVAIVGALIGLCVLFGGITGWINGKSRQKEHVSRIGETETTHRPQHASTIVPIDRWRESSVIVKASRPDSRFGVH